MTENEFIIECKKINLEVTEEILTKLKEYYELLKEWNNKFNLTTIIQEEDVYLKHFYDSVCIYKSGYIENKKIKLCDFGTGAGFPGIVIKIFFPLIDVTLIESNKKKCMFLEEVISKLCLKDIKVVCDRCEEYAKKNREVFDIVTCRAVSALKVILELSIPIIKINGLFIPLKANIDEELKESKTIEQELNSKLLDIINYNLPKDSGIRNILIYRKEKETSLKYPREYKKIIK